MNIYTTTKKKIDEILNIEYKIINESGFSEYNHPIITPVSISNPININSIYPLPSDEEMDSTGYTPTKFNISVKPSSQINNSNEMGYAKLNILGVDPIDGVALSLIYSSAHIPEGFMFGECIITKPLYFLTFEIRISTN